MLRLRPDDSDGILRFASGPSGGAVLPLGKGVGLLVGGKSCDWAPDLMVRMLSR